VTIEPLVIDLVVECEPAHAFDVWTTRFGDWWPRAHSVSGDPAAIVLETRLGGRIYERLADGQEIEWGEVTAWEPPIRLGYLWHIRRDRADATDVELTFARVADGTTRIEIVHSGWERLGEGAEEWRDANRGGWDGLLPHFVTAVTNGLDDMEER
jgi:hypothetical protein